MKKPHALKIPLTTLATALILSGSAMAGTVTISATGVSSSPIFVTSNLSSISVGTEFRIGTIYDVNALNSIIATYKAGVEGVGNTLAQAQADAATKSSLLYNNTVSWLSNASNMANFVTAADSVNQVGTTASGKFLFNNTATRTVNGVSGTYGGSNGSLTVTYANYVPGTGAKLWAWFATGTEIAIVTDSTWLVPVNNASGLTIGSANLISTGSGDPTELLLATYTDYSSGSDLISSVKVAETYTVVPEPSTGALVLIGAFGLVAMRRLRKI